MAARGIEPDAPGMIEGGNIDPWDRPVLQNDDGSYSTTSSMSFGDDKGEVLIPTVIDGKRLSEEDAINNYRQTGQRLGIFDTPENADAYSQELHNRQTLTYPNADMDYLKKLSSAYDQGNSYDDIVQHALETGGNMPAKPSLDAAMSGKQLGPEDYRLAPTINDALSKEGINPDDFYNSIAFGGSTKAVGEAATSLVGWLHGSNVALTDDAMRAGRSLWLTQNPAVAKNVGNILHDVELRPGAAVDISAEGVGKSALQQQQIMYDRIQKLQLDNPENYRYVDMDIAGQGLTRGVLNQKSSVYSINPRRR